MILLNKTTNKTPVLDRMTQLLQHFTPLKLPKSMKPKVT